MEGLPDTAGACLRRQPPLVVAGRTAPLEYLKLAIDTLSNTANGVDAFGPFSWKRVKPAL